MPFVSPSFGSHIKAASKQHLHKALHTCYLYCVLSTTIPDQPFPPEAQNEKAPCVSEVSTFQWQVHTCWTKMSRDSKSELLSLHELTLDIDLIPSSLNFPISKI